MMTKFKLFLLLTGSIMFLSAAGCGRQDGTEDVAQSESGAVVPLTDRPLAAYQSELLEHAFETATAIPVKPHMKDRARAQGKVVEASLELNQPLRAQYLVERIDNWRRGSGYCDLALYCARRGYADETQQYLNLAVQIAELAEDWRRDQVKGKIANTYAWLGQTLRTGQPGADAMDAGEDHFEGHMNALDALIAPGNFDIVENALKACANLFNRFYNDAGRRLLTEEKIKASWGKLPVFKRVELLTELAGFALEHADQVKALELTNEAQQLIDSVAWRPEHHIPLTSGLIKLRFRAGTLRPLAEAYQSMGDTETALAVYKRAVQEGVENPNSRPRAEDLSATCCSMALYGAMPDAELWIRIQQIKDGLGNPW